MGNPGAPFGGPYTGQGNQGLGGTGLGPQLQIKSPMPNRLPQFNVDKKNQPMQGMAAMVGSRSFKYWGEMVRYQIFCWGHVCLCQIFCTKQFVVSTRTIIRMHIVTNTGLQSITSSFKLLYVHPYLTVSPPFPAGHSAGTNWCGRSLWCPRRRCHWDGAQRSGRSSWPWCAGFSSISHRWRTTHRRSRETQANPTATGPPATCAQVPAERTGQR